MAPRGRAPRAASRGRGPAAEIRGLRVTRGVEEGARLVRDAGRAGEGIAVLRGNLAPDGAGGLTLPGEMDFLVGHLFPELFERFGYPRRNALAAPMVVSTRKFHDAPVDAGLRKQHECEIAYVGHQSEPPESQRERVLAELAGDKVIRQAVESMYPRISGRWMSRLLIGCCNAPLEGATRSSAE